MNPADLLTRNRAAVAVAVLLVGAAVGGYVYLGGGAGGAPTGMVVQALELSTNSDLEVLQVEDRGSLDRVVLSDGSTVINAYVTEDRKYLVQATSNGQVVQGFVPLRNLTRTLQARNSFISCLDRRNATFYGVASNNRTLAPYTRSMQAQLQVLGGQQALQLFGGVGPRQIQRLVFDYNRTRGIVWQVNGSLSGGVHTIPMLQQRSGCTLGVDTGPYG